MKITIDTSEMEGKLKKGIETFSKHGGVGMRTGKLIGKMIKEKADRKAIESKAKSPFEPLVRQQRVEAGKKKLKELGRSRKK